MGTFHHEVHQAGNTTTSFWIKFKKNVILELITFAQVFIQILGVIAAIMLGVALFALEFKWVSSTFEKVMPLVLMIGAVHFFTIFSWYLGVFLVALSFVNSKFKMMAMGIIPILIFYSFFSSILV